MGGKNALSEGEETLALHLKAEKIPFSREIRFHPERMWRFDFVLVGYRIGIEVEGGTWTPKKSRHSSGKGFEEDCRKYNEAARLDWKVYRFTTDMVKSGEAIDYIREILSK